MALKNRQLLLGGTVLCISLSSLATTTLHHINQQITAVQHSLKRAVAQQNHWQASLKETELHSATLLTTLRQTQSTLRTQKHHIDTLSMQAQHYQQQLTQLRDHLAETLKAAYILGNQPPLKQLLSPQSSATVNRNLMYLHYLEKQRSQDILQIDAVLKAAKTNLENIQNEYKSLRITQDTELKALHQLHQNAKQRRQLIHKMNHAIHTQQQRLHILLHNKQHLDLTLRNLSKNPLLYAAIGHSFSQLKHHLSRPTKGKIMKLFGIKIQKSQLRWKGVLIKAPMHQPVYAVADGKVLFAKWMPGYGLLMILYHGRGYMTLYGRNQILYKHAGDTVQAGDKIAAVGESGGFEFPALYFAIRHNTAALNPTHWFRR